MREMALVEPLRLPYLPLAERRDENGKLDGLPLLFILLVLLRLQLSGLQWHRPGLRPRGPTSGRLGLSLLR